MRVRGNVRPGVVEVTAYEPIPGKAEVRVRENITPFTEIDPMTEQEVTGYEYDEYMFVVNDAPHLKETVEAYINEWLLTGRSMEIDTRATLYVTARNDAVDEYTEELIEEGLL